VDTGWRVRERGLTAKGVAPVRGPLYLEARLIAWAAEAVGEGKIACPQIWRMLRSMTFT